MGTGVGATNQLQMPQLEQEFIYLLPEWISDHVSVTLRSGRRELHQIADYELVQIDNLLSKLRQLEIRFVPQSRQRLVYRDPWIVRTPNVSCPHFGQRQYGGLMKSLGSIVIFSGIVSEMMTLPNAGYRRHACKALRNSVRKTVASTEFKRLDLASLIQISGAAILAVGTLALRNIRPVQMNHRQRINFPLLRVSMRRLPR